MSIAPMLDQVLASEAPPPIESFKVLPFALDIPSHILRKLMIVHAMVLEKVSENLRLGVGSATNQPKYTIFTLLF
ncbi:hypothetical protein H2198_000589 [Neophaeococcomyces mojaviensis]|uniref:Uncharacterized protein n=1 Tax=Neophaeococcomyces mojaviensis TaxID=3383035 RepID=A0ACC3AK70_9EURO|nr:hypothetical protein H2198_000589 [Knufia sp. JES_112]